jgi:RNA polymerase sigma-70 factor (ECF subfamily)
VRAISTSIVKQTAVVERAIDEAGFDALYAATAARLRSYLRRATGEASLAEDLVQETFMRFLRAQPINLEERQQLAYLYRTATSLLTDHWRAVNRQRRWQSISWIAPRSRLAQERLDVAQVFRKLNVRDQALLWLAYVEGFDHTEIGAALQLRPRSVRVVLSRARKRLASLMTTHGLGPSMRKER